MTRVLPSGENLHPLNPAVRLLPREHTQACRSTFQQHQTLSNPSEHLSRHQNRVDEHTLRRIPAPPPAQSGRCLVDPLPRPTIHVDARSSSLHVVTTVHLGMASMPLCPPRRFASRIITIHNNLWVLAIALDSHRGKEDVPCIR